MNNLLALVLAAGKGTRMKSGLIKVLHPVAGKVMINHVLKNLTEIQAKIICIVGYQAEKVKREISGEKNIEFITQEKQLGTGHAVLQARDHIATHQGPVLVLYGDTPLLKSLTLKRLVKVQQQQKAAAAVLTAEIEDPSGYGRVVRTNNKILKIVEDEDASEDERNIQEVNSGVYCFDGEKLADALKSLTPDNAQGEYYLTDTLEYLTEEGEQVVPVMAADPEEIHGVNDRRDLARTEKVLRQRIIDYHLRNGVTIIDPETTYIDAEVEIGRDTVVYPFSYLEGETKIAKRTVIGPHSRLISARVGKEVNIQSHCIIRESVIGNKCNIGPFAYIRPGCRIDDEVKIGDYVELKKASVARGSKVPHLSYVGDAEIGSGTNIGAGTIFANYDGKNKHKTIVGNSAFIGSNTTLVAPVRVKDRGKTGAGSVVTHDVNEDTTVVGVPAREFKKDGDKGDD